MSDRENIHGLLDVMLNHELVMVTVDIKNLVGEVTKPKGWWGHVTEIRRPASDINAYGHLDPVVVVVDPNPSDSIFYLLSPDMVER